MNAADETFFYYIEASYGDYLWKHLTQYPRPFVLLDVGANQGLFSIAALRNPNVIAVYAFEPVEATFRLLEKNLRLNHGEGKWRAIRAAISDRVGEGVITLAENHSGAATMRGFGNNSEVTASTIETVKLWAAEKLEKEIPNENVPIVVKLDVEGHEQVVLGEILACSFSNQIESIFIEIDEKWVDSAEIMRTLAEHGLGAQRVVGEGSHYDLHAWR